MMKKALTSIFFLTLLLLSCTSDDNNMENIFTNIEGTVQGTTSCDTDGKGLAYEIIPNNHDLSSSFIITATLPEELKKEGLRIKFDMKPSQKDITFCTANFAPDQFYEVFNAIILNE